MPDWTRSMIQTFEFYTVDTSTWKDKGRLGNVKSCTIKRDLEVETLGSATIDVADLLGENYIRAYLVTEQDGLKEKIPLGTFLVQTPQSNFDGKMRNVSMDAYTPLLELKENPPPIGYFILKGSNIMDEAYRLAREHLRAPVSKPTSDSTLYYDFVSNTNDTWLSFLIDLISQAKFTFSLDETGRVLFSPKQDTASLQPVWTYNDDNSSILSPELDMDHDLYGIPNVVEVVYSNGVGAPLYARVVNDDPGSPTSTVNRGREILYRVTDPSITGNPVQNEIEEYAQQLLSELSTVEYTIRYSHGYCPTRIGDCVRLNYSRAGLEDVKAKVISQSIKCEAGCLVTETAIFTNKLWG